MGASRTMRFRLPRVGLGAVLVAVVVACTTAPSPTPSVAVAPDPSSGASIANQSADLRFAIDGELTYFSPAPRDAATTWIVDLLYRGLYRVDDHLTVIPDIAEALPAVSADGLTWTIQLKDGVRWSDGSPFTSADVKFTEDMARSKRCPFLDFCGDLVENIETPDASTVEFRLRERYAPFLFVLSRPMMPKDAVTASFARLEASLGAVDAASVTALSDHIQRATSDETCSSEAPPAACNPGTYVAQIEPLLAPAGITLPDKRAYTSADKLDANAYGQALIDDLNGLNGTLTADEPDKLAAAFRLLDFHRAPVGNGPYTFVDYTPGQGVELARNPTYDVHEVGPEKVYATIIKDGAAALAALQHGDIDFLPEVSSNAVATLKADENVVLSEFTDFVFYYIGFNLRDGHIYADKALRKAFSMCIDHDRTVTAATGGNGIPVYADVSPASWAFDSSVPHYVHDVAGARALIEGAGWELGADGVYAKAGQRLSTDLYVREGRPERIRFAQLARDQLKECGIEINVKISDFAKLLALTLYPNDFDTYLAGFGTAEDPESWGLFHSSHCTTKENPDDYNFVCWSNAEADGLLVEGRQEVDQAKRKAIYARLQHLVHDDLPYYFLWSDLAHRGYSNAVTSSDGAIDFSSPRDYWNMDTWVVNPSR